MGDLISKRAAIVALDNKMSSSLENVDMQIAMGFAKGIIHDLPSVTPAEKTGRWIKIVTEKDEHHETWHYECSECRRQGSMFGNDPYCGNCGAKMEVSG